MTICVLCLVSGRVQGVWYRAGARNQALRLGLTGYAKNLHDGRVEVLACGEPASIETLKAWLWRGPPGAEVELVECRLAEQTAPIHFVTR